MECESAFSAHLRFRFLVLSFNTSTPETRELHSDVLLAVNDVMTKLFSFKKRWCVPTGVGQLTADLRLFLPGASQL
jgi:hypothetical protein